MSCLDLMAFGSARFPFALARHADRNADHDPHSTTNPGGATPQASWQTLIPLTPADLFRLGEQFDLARAAFLGGYGQPAVVVVPEKVAGAHAVGSGA